MVHDEQTLDKAIGFFGIVALIVLLVPFAPWIIGSAIERLNLMLADVSPALALDPESNSMAILLTMISTGLATFFGAWLAFRWQARRQQLIYYTDLAHDVMWAIHAIGDQAQFCHSLFALCSQSTEETLALPNMYRFVPPQKWDPKAFKAILADIETELAACEEGQNQLYGVLVPLLDQYKNLDRIEIEKDTSPTYDHESRFTLVDRKALKESIGESDYNGICLMLDTIKVVSLQCANDFLKHREDFAANAIIGMKKRGASVRFILKQVFPYPEPPHPLETDTELPDPGGLVQEISRKNKEKNQEGVTTEILKTSYNLGSGQIPEKIVLSGSLSLHKDK